MKAYFKYLLPFIFLFPGFHSVIVAQSTSVAFVDLSYLYANWSEATQNKQIIQNYTKQLEDNLDGKKKELKQKYQGVPSTQAELDTRTAQLKGLEEQLAAQGRSNYQLLQQKLQEQQQTMTQKIRAAIDQVAKERKYTCVLDKGQALYLQGGDDITAAVLQKLTTK